MKTIEHEGQTFVLKTDIEAAFKERISKLSSRAIQAEEQAKALQDNLDSQSGELTKISKLQEKVTTLEASLQDAESKYSRVSMVQIILSDGTLAEGEVTHSSLNQVVISFQISLSGEIILR